MIERIPNVFVYGTLRSHGCHNDKLKFCDLLGNFETLPLYSMHRVSYYPAVTEGGKTAIKGEVFRLNEGSLSALDDLEDYPYLYSRKMLKTPFGDAWIYLYKESVEGHDLIESGDWLGQQSFLTKVETSCA